MGLQLSSTWIAGVWATTLIVSALVVTLIVQMRARRRLDASLQKATRFRTALGNLDHLQDGGVGFVANQRVERLGLVSIRERVRSIGGELKVRSAPGQGTVIEARAPVRSRVAAPGSAFDRSSSRFDHSPPPFLSDTSRIALG